MPLGGVLEGPFFKKTHNHPRNRAYRSPGLHNDCPDLKNYRKNSHFANKNTTLEVKKTRRSQSKLRNGTVAGYARSALDNNTRRVKLRNLPLGVESHRSRKSGCRKMFTLLDLPAGFIIFCMITISTVSMRQNQSISFSAATGSAQYFSAHLYTPWYNYYVQSSCPCFLIPTSNVGAELEMKKLPGPAHLQANQVLDVPPPPSRVWFVLCCVVD